MAIDTIKTSAILDGSVTSADLDTNIDITGRVSGGTLGVGTSTISSGKVAMDASSNNYIRFADGGSLTGLVGLSDGGTLVTGTTDGDFVIRTETSGGALVFGGTGGGKWGQFDSDGLKFNGDTAAANALSDYEVGTYTPTVTDALGGGNSCSLSSASGRYAKVGNLVWNHIDVTGINTAGITTNNVLCFLLPFTPAASSFSSDYYWTNINYNPNDIPSFQIINGYIRGRFVLTRDNTTGEYLREGTINDGNSNVSITMVYYTTA